MMTPFAFSTNIPTLPESYIGLNLFQDFMQKLVGDSIGHRYTLRARG
jgi:hypothetical protein